MPTVALPLHLTPAIALWLTLGIFPALYLSAILHEAGHAFAGRLAGFQITSLGMGTSHPLLVFRLPGRGPRALRPLFYLCRTDPFQGITWYAAPDILPARTPLLVLLFGGIAANTLIASVTLPLWRATGLPVWLVLGIANGTLALTNLVPFVMRVGGQSSGNTAGNAALFRSDGAQALGMLLPRAHYHAQAPAALVAFRSLWEAVGDYQISTVQAYTAALAAMDVGDEETARALRMAAQTAAGGDLLSSDRIVRVLASLLDGALSEREQDWSAAARFYREVAMHYPASTTRYAAPLLAEASACLCDARASGLTSAAIQAAQETLDRLAQAPAVKTYPALRIHLLSTRILLLSEASAAGTPLPSGWLETLLARYDAARYRSRSDVLDLRTFTATARARERDGDRDGAALQYERAVGAARAVLDALQPDPEMQDRFTDRMRATLVADTVRCLDSLERTVDARTIETLFPDATEREAARRLGQRRDAGFQREAGERQARLLRLAGLISGGAALAGLWEAATSHTDFARGLAGVLLLSPVASGLVYLIGLARRRLGGQAQAPSPEGLLVLLTAVLPWLLALFLSLTRTSRP